MATRFPAPAAFPTSGPQRACKQTLDLSKSVTCNPLSQGKLSHLKRNITDEKGAARPELQVVETGGNRRLLLSWTSWRRGADREAEGPGRWNGSCPNALWPPSRPDDSLGGQECGAVASTSLPSTWALLEGASLGSARGTERLWGRGQGQRQLLLLCTGSHPRGGIRMRTLDPGDSSPSTPTHNPGTLLFLTRPSVRPASSLILGRQRPVHSMAPLPGPVQAQIPPACLSNAPHMPESSSWREGGSSCRPASAPWDLTGWEGAVEKDSHPHPERLPSDSVGEPRAGRSFLKGGT